MRTFIAIDLPETVKSVLAELQLKFRKCGADVRWVKTGNIHLTLQFLGDVEEKNVKSIIESIEGTCINHRPFTVKIKGAGVFPGTKAPKVIWIGLEENDKLSELQRDLENGLVSLGFKREKRKFTPHLTLGRFRSSARKAELMDMVRLNKESDFGLMDINSVSLIKSDLGQAGARYTNIAAIRLGNPGGCYDLNALRG